MKHAVSSFVAAFVAVGVVVAGAGSSNARSGAESVTRTLYVSAIDKNGSPVTDLQAVDFEVKEGGKTQTLASVKPAEVPLRIAVIDADQGTGAFQLGIGRLMQKLLGHAEFALISVLVQPEKIVDYSHDGAALSAGLTKLGPRGRQGGAQLLEAIQEATKDVGHEARRPVILVVRLGGEGLTSLGSRDVREQLRKSGAVLHVISAAGAQGQPGSQARQGIGNEQAQNADSELADSINNLNQVLGDGSKESGGRHDQVVATTHAKALEQLADELLHQYELTYTAPDGAKPGEKIAVSTKRKGVTVYAPSRLPN
jgi:VWFA-related protein